MKSSCGKLAKVMSSPLDFRADAGQLGKLFGGQVGLDSALEGIDQRRDAHNHTGPGELLLQGAHDGILVIDTFENALVADARQGKRLFAVQDLLSRWEDQPGAAVFGSAAIYAVRQVDRDATNCIHDLFEGAHVDRHIAVGSDAKVQRQRARQQARTFARTVVVTKAGIAVEISLVELLVVLPVDVVGDVGDFHPQVARKFQDGHLGLDKVHAHNTDDICQTVIVGVGTRICADRQQAS